MRSSCILLSCVCLSWPAAWTLSRLPREGQHCWRSSLATVVKPSLLLLHCLLSGMLLSFQCQSEPAAFQGSHGLVPHMVDSAARTIVDSADVSAEHNFPWHLCVGAVKAGISACVISCLSALAEHFRLCRTVWRNSNHSQAALLKAQHNHCIIKVADTQSAAVPAVTKNLNSLYAVLCDL